MIPAALILVGTLGFLLIEGKSLLDSLYLTVITLTTVGYGDVKPDTDAGKVFTMFLALGGIFTLFYTAAETIRMVVGGEMRIALERQRMERSLAEQKDHMIVCGFGRMGRLVCKEFSAQKIPFVVIERQAEQLENFRMPLGLALHGDATLDEVLRKAGVGQARALVSLVASDADNLYITMSARLLNDKLFIVARAEDERSEQKLLRAGANRVISPYLIGGFRVAQAVLRPTVVDFIELATRTEYMEIQIEETRIAPHSTLVGTPLKASQLREELGIIVVAIKKATGRMIYNPSSDTVLEAGDTLIALGHRQQLDQLEKMAKG